MQDERTETHAPTTPAAATGSEREDCRAKRRELRVAAAVESEYLLSLAP